MPISSTLRYIWLLLTSIAGIVLADLVVYCEHNTNAALKRTGGYKEYSECSGNVCTCYAFELLCMERTPAGVFILESRNYDYASSCPITSCLCNLAGYNAWETTA